MYYGTRVLFTLTLVHDHGCVHDHAHVQQIVTRQALLTPLCMPL